jgi:geranyl-CoA carboxylase alpha subunit
LVAEGDQVEQGQTLVILEAMKMEHPVKADRSGTIGQLLARQGDQVKRGQLLVQVEANEEADA